MIKQTLMFTSEATLTFKNQQMVISIKESDDTITRPIEDIGFVIIDNPMVKVSMPLLNALADNNVSVIFCNNKRMPNAMLMSLNANATLQEGYRYQFAATEPMKKNIWKQIIECKIKNQAALLNKLNKRGDVLKPYYMAVKSGDTDNREGLAAKIYWNRLIGDDFKRDRDGPSPNNLLNYGYTLLRASVARALAGSGLFPALGLFHKSRYNPFPLADDVMEPYRPYVDEMVYYIYHIDGETELNTATKQRLLRVLFADVGMGRVTRPLEVAISLTTSSLLKIFKGDVKTMSLPSLE